MGDQPAQPILDPMGVSLGVEPGASGWFVAAGADRLPGERVFWSRGLIAFFVFASFGTLWSGMALPLHSAPWRLSEVEIGRAR